MRRWTIVEKEICRAIKEKRVIKFYYKGYLRIVEPYAYGIHKTTYNKILRAFQIAGGSSSEEIVGWKLFIVDEISFLITTNEQFNVRPEYTLNDSAMGKIICQVDY